MSVWIDVVPVLACLGCDTDGRVLCARPTAHALQWITADAIAITEQVTQAGAGQRQVDVTLGIESDERVEIEAGLEEGQVVIAP